MKTCFRVVGSLLAATFCGSVWAESVDWGAYSGRTYTVAAGAEVTVTESEMAAFNQIGELAFADKTGKVVFDGCLTAPNVEISGSGTIRKTGDAVWALSRRLPNFTGQTEIGGGFVSLLDHLTLGAFESDSPKPSISVESGATLCVSNNTVYFKRCRISIAGSGFNGAGAILNAATGGSNRFNAGITLTDDALVNFEKDEYVIGSLKLDGHTLRKTGPGHLCQSGAPASGGGSVILEPGESASKPTAWTIRERSILTQDNPLQALYLNNFAYLRLWNNPVAQTGPIYASGKVEIFRYNQPSTGYIVETPEYNRFEGPIVMSNAETTITFNHNGDNSSAAGKPAFTNRLHVVGQISGPGSVVATGNGRLYLDCPTNAWTGTTTFTRKNDFSRIILGAPGSVPDYSKFSVAGNGVRINVETGHWTVGALVRLLNEATYSSGTTRGVAFDATCDTNRTDFVVSGTDVVALTNETQFLEMSEVGKTVTITGGTDVIEMPKLLVGGGTLRLAGLTTKVRLADKTAVGALAYDDWAMLRIEDGADVEIPSDEIPSPFSVGKPDGSSVTNPKCRLVVSNATLRTEHWKKSYLKSATNALTVASSTRYGLVETYDGALVSNKFVMAGAAGTCAAVHQHGGTVAAFGDWGGNLATATIIGYFFGHGYWLVEDGLMAAVGAMCLAQNNATGVFEMRGGTYDQRTFNNMTGFYAASSSGDSRASVICRGNSRFTDVSITLGKAARSEGTLTVAENAQVSVDNCYLAADNAANRGIVNLNGGVLEAAYVCGAKTNGQCAPPNRPEALAVNFDGGTLRCSRNNAGVFSYRNTPGHEGNNAAPCITVFKGGAVLDIPANVTVTVDPPLERPYGGGVERIDWTSSGYEVAPPFVRIEGDGTGASAVCDYDPKSGLVTNVTVTSRGNGYSWAKAYFIMGSHAAATNAVVDCTVTSNETELEQSGGVTKTGAGTLVLSATNGWVGVTTVAGGVLKADAGYAIPSNAVVRLAGGDLNLNGKAACITGVVYAAGGGRILNAGAATLPDAFSLETTVDDIVAGKAIALAGDVDLEGVPLTVFGDDFSALDPKKKGGYPVVTATGTLTGAPALTSEPLPANWAFRPRGNKISLVYLKGTMLIVR